MKQLIQSYKTGDLGVYDVPAPLCDDNGVLVKTNASLVSAGTEKMIIDIAKKSLLGKARSRPDLVRQVIDKMQREGIRNTLEKVFTKLDTPIPLGYSCAGVVLEKGSHITDIAVGDRVACGGAGYANHSEMNYVPKNLLVPIPDAVDDIEASFVTVGAIALQGVRQADPRLGEKFAVIGLGLIGQLTVQLLKSAGCQVIGSDVDPDKLELAKRLGADVICNASELVAQASSFSDGYGVDSAIITASTNSNQPVNDAGLICRIKGKVVAVGLVGMQIQRDIYYKKELDFRLSMAYGPGRYDPEYEELGIDYPYSYVRFTEQRNFQTFLQLVAEKKVTPKELITHTFDIVDAEKAYNLLEGKIDEKYLGIVLTYSNNITLDQHKSVRISQETTSSPVKNSNVRAGLIGAGNFTKSVILPTIKKNSEIELSALVTATGLSGHSTGKKYGIPLISTDTEELLNSEEINSLIVTTRHNDHGPKVLQAIKAGKHIFVEKPLCFTPSELQEIKEIYSGETMLQVGFNRRFSPLIKQMKQNLPDAPLSINYRINAGEIPLNVWIQDSSIGGGRIIGEVCHFIDTCSYLTGSTVEKVYAACVHSSDTSIPNEDNVSIILQYKNGSTATIGYYAYGDSSLAKEHIEVFAPHIALQLNDFRSLVLYQNGKKRKTKTSGQDKGFTDEFDAFAESVKSGVPAIPAESLFNTTAASFKVLESLRTERTIYVHD